MKSCARCWATTAIPDNEHDGQKEFPLAGPRPGDLAGPAALHGFGLSDRPGLWLLALEDEPPDHEGPRELSSLPSLRDASRVRR